MRLRRLVSMSLIGGALAVSGLSAWYTALPQTETLRSFLSQVFTASEDETDDSSADEQFTEQVETAVPVASDSFDPTPSDMPLVLQSLLPNFRESADRRFDKRVAEVTVDRGSTLSSALYGFGLDHATIDAISSALKPYSRPSKLAIGTRIEALWPAWPLRAPSSLALHLDATRKVIIEGAERTWSARREDKEVNYRLAAYSGVVTSSLWSSATSAGMDPNLISKLAEIFAWQIDFNREVRLNDRWRLTVEHRFVEGQPIGYGDIIAAEYENGGNVLTAVRHLSEAGHASYFAPDGTSLRRMFRRSPLEYARITSGFSTQRFHPILKINRPHLGVDYGAPVGTPIMAVGDGAVTFAARNGGSGHMIRIRHNASYQTTYRHLSAYATNIRPGTRVQMGQVIGYVGATGLATGPHLHFEFQENGRVVDPLGLRFPVADPVSNKERDRFVTLATHQVNELPPWSRAMLTVEQGRSPKPTAGE